MNLPSLTTRELLQHAWVVADPLTQTDLERELIGRLEAAAEHELVLDAIDELGLDLTKTRDLEKTKAAVEFADEFDLVNARAVIGVLGEFDIDSPDDLRNRLDRLQKLDQALQDLITPLTTLQTLTTTE